MDPQKNGRRKDQPQVYLEDYVGIQKHVSGNCKKHRIGIDSNI